MMIEPHGGQLVYRVLQGEERDEAARRAARLHRLILDPWAASDLELLAVGAYSPLVGFMNSADYKRVVEEMRLANGTVWSLPIVLGTAPAVAEDIKIGDEVALVNVAGLVLGLLVVEDKYTCDKLREAKMVFGTDDPAHPGVARLYGRGEVLLGGAVSLLNKNVPERFADLYLEPAKTRQAFRERGWRSVVGFQTRNPVHRAHEYLLKCALEMADGLFLNPLLGETKSDDVPAAVRVECYRALLDSYFPKDRVFMSAFPAAMRYAGPREAIFHALVRKNYGATHFIVGRDHAGVGNYYGTYDAQLVFQRFSPAEIGITPLFFEHSFYCRACGSMASAKTCPHEAQDHIFLSGTRVRELLAAGELPPEEFTRREVARVLAGYYRGHATGGFAQEAKRYGT